MRFSVATFIAACAGLTSACSQAPVGSNPSGNPISKPGLGQIVPAGTPFSITWNPTTAGKVSIVLLRGPSTNVVPIACLGEGLPNSGNFVWTPSTSLTADVTHYGLQIIVDGTGQFQYSTQFGVSNPVGSVSTSASVTTKQGIVSQIGDGQVQAPTGATTTAASVSSKSAKSSGTAPAPSMSPVHSANVTTKPIVVAPITTAPVVVASTGAPSNSSIVQPTKSMSVPATLQTIAPVSTNSSPAATSPTTKAPAATGAGAKFVAGGMMVGLGMMAALVL